MLKNRKKKYVNFAVVNDVCHIEISISSLCALPVIHVRNSVAVCMIYCIPVCFRYFPCHEFDRKKI